ncbi:uncharacterized protein LOC133804615 [Humulus lupulus]|uniref:uncharacterized protein LOC133804615 n=1 Tax=Humulus lupulus TaxID=3486 RepID=UPI002B40B28C|nr:uncharacterized protein LOC133804615 [Humulus lupulus]
MLYCTSKKHDWIVMPYNHGEHWMLFLLYSNWHYCCFLDPLNAPLDNRTAIKETIHDAFEMYFTERMKARQKINKRPSGVKYFQPTCRKQPNNIDCGYYVMRMMKNVLINAPHIKHFLSKQFTSDKPYTTQEIDEVREEWAMSFLQLVRAK